MHEIDAAAHYCFSHGTPRLLLVMEMEIKTSWKVGTARVVTRCVGIQSYDVLCRTSCHMAPKYF